MDKTIQDIFSWQTILFCLGIYFFTLIIRRFVDRLLAFYQQKRALRHKVKADADKHLGYRQAPPSNPPSNPPQPLLDMVWWWRSFFLPLLPLFVGGLVAAILKNYPYPTFVVEKGIRGLFGVVCGGASGWLYAMVKNMVRKAGGMKLDEDVEGATKDEFSMKMDTPPSKASFEELPKSSPPVEIATTTETKAATPAVEEKKP